jgi:hypothetical protein
LGEKFIRQRREPSIAHNPDDECQDFFLAISSINMEASIAHNPDDECQDLFLAISSIKTEARRL